MRVAVLDDYHRVFEADPAIELRRRRVPVDIYTDKVPLERHLIGVDIDRDPPAPKLNRRVGLENAMIVIQHCDAHGRSSNGLTREAAC